MSTWNASRAKRSPIGFAAPSTTGSHSSSISATTAAPRTSRVAAPDDYTPAHDTPDEQLVAAVSEADYGEWIGVTVEFTAAALKAMARNVRDDRTVPHWIRHAVHVRFSSIDRDLEIKSPVQVDVPREIAERVQLKATYFVVSDSTDDYADALHNILLEFVQPQFEYLVDGESIDPDDE